MVSNIKVTGVGKDSWTAGLFPSGLSKQDLKQVLQPLFVEQLNKEKIPGTPDMLLQFEQLYLPLAAWVAKQHGDDTFFLGVHGAQGTGKSTLSSILRAMLQEGFNKRVMCLSLDDFYLTHQQRLTLSQTIHPLLQTRGVPGTHDVELMLSVLTQLKQKTKKDISIPVFDKSIDDRLPESHWQKIRLPVDIVIFEGWCVGARAEDESVLTTPVNQLEREEDREAHWRRYVNQQLVNHYQRVFDQLDRLLMLQAPSMEKVYDWRLLQEQKLQTRTTVDTNTRIMSDRELKRFIMHYERITRNALEEMPARADIVLRLNDDHLVDSIKLNTQH